MTRSPSRHVKPPAVTGGILGAVRRGAAAAGSVVGVLVLALEPRLVDVRVGVHVVAVAVLVIVLGVVVVVAIVRMGVRDVAVAMLVAVRRVVSVLVLAGHGSSSRRRAPARAPRAEPVDREVAELRVVPDLLAQRPPHAVQPRPLDALDAPAPVADDVLTRAAARKRIETGAVAEVHMPDHAERLEALERAVDRRRLDRRRAPRAAARDVVGGDGPLGREQGLEHEAAGGAEPTAAAAQLRGDVVEVVEDERLAAGREG